MITVASGDTYRTADELDLQYYVNLARKQIGKTYDLRFQSDAKCRQKAGEFEILDFEEKNARWELNDYYLRIGQEIITGADLGTFTIRFKNTKFYNGKVMRFHVQAYVQDKNGVNDHLFIGDVNEESGKGLKAYRFPILNWNYKVRQ